MTSLGHETFPNLVFTSEKKQAQAVLEATAASQMFQTLQMWRRAGCTKGRCWVWRSRDHPITRSEVQAPGLSLAEGWTILWPGTVQSPEPHPYQPKTAMEKTSWKVSSSQEGPIHHAPPLLPGTVTTSDSDMTAARDREHPILEVPPARLAQPQPAGLPHAEQVPQSHITGARGVRAHAAHAA